MRKIRLLAGCLVFGWLFALAQVPNMTQGAKLPPVRTLEAQGWKVQHAQWAFDSLCIYFSALAPGKSDYDLYILPSEGWRWGAPRRIDALCSEKDEWWPSICSDESAIYFVRRTPAVAGEKNSYEQTQICRSWRQSNVWTAAEPIIISGTEDTRPKIAEDNCTLTFYRRQESKKHDGAWHQYRTVVVDEHNWLLPDTCSVAPKPEPINIITGTLVDAASGMPLTSARVVVYNAITQQILQTAAVHGATGRFRIALGKGEQYRIDATADGYSHRYFERDERQLKRRTKEELGEVPLSKSLHIALKVYDGETQENLGEEKKDLSIGAIYPIVLRRNGYRDTTVTLNTERQVLFAEAEIDVPLTPKKSKHRIAVVNSKTGEPIHDALIRMNGHMAPADTALRLEKNISMQVSAAGYFFYDTLFNTGKEERERHIHVALQPIEKDFVLQLRNIQFDHDSYAIREESNSELNQLLHLMQINPTLRIELSAHTDDKGTDKYNDRLSSLRGNAVAQWLTARGIAKDRIEAVGYGKRKPIVPNDSDEHRALNRRVEIKVIDY